MTRLLTGIDIANRLNAKNPGVVTTADLGEVWIKPESLSIVARILKDTLGLEFTFLRSITAVDYIGYFEIVYHLLSMRHNHEMVMKVRCSGRDELVVPSVVGIWQGADLQEREIWDLMGIRFEGHPNMKRVLLWEGFDGHPLRKDYLG